MLPVLVPDAQVSDYGNGDEAEAGRQLGADLVPCVVQPSDFLDRVLFELTTHAGIIVSSYMVCALNGWQGGFTPLRTLRDLRKTTVRKILVFDCAGAQPNP